MTQNENKESSCFAFETEERKKSNRNEDNCGYI